MTIRAALQSDYPAIIEAIRAFVGGSSYAAHDSVNDAHVAATLKALGEADDGCVIVMDDDAGQFAGVFIGMAHPHLFSGVKMCGELFVYVRPDLRGRGKELKATAEAWAKSRGCQSMTFSFPESEAHLDPVYRKWGYFPCERAYRKELD